MAIEGRSEAALGRRIRLGMIGGGEGAFIGAVHRLAARMDDHYEFVAGALSSTPDKARRSGEALGLAPDRVYGDYLEMAKADTRDLWILGGWANRDWLKWSSCLTCILLEWN